MPTYDIRPLQLRILPILEALDNTCREHGMRYFIWAGTMIGAVRHKGFIPWDDDLDIAMPRPDYDKLIAHCREWLPEPFEMVCAENDDVYPLPFAKIQDGSTTLIERMHLKYLGGIYLDVFPIDGAPKGWLAQKWHFGRYEYYKRVLYLLFRDPYKHGHGPSSWIPLLCRSLYSLHGVQAKIRKILTKYNYDDCDLVVRKELELCNLGSHKVNKLISNDLYNHLTRIETLHNVLTDGLFAYSIYELFNNLKVNVSLEERTLNLFHSCLNIILSYNTLASEVFKYIL